MVRSGRDRLSGRVQVSVTDLRSEFRKEVNFSEEEGILVAIACEEAVRGVGRIRLCQVPDTSTASLQSFVQEAIEPGSLVFTLGCKFGDLESKGYHYDSIRLSRIIKAEKEPRVHRVGSQLDNWLFRTHRGAVSQKHLGFYLDEFTFRFNRRNAHFRGELFRNLLKQAIELEPSPFKDLVGGQSLKRVKATRNRPRDQPL